MLENQQSNSFLIRCKHNYINIHQKLGTLDLCNLIPTLCKHKNKSSGRMMEMLNFCSQIALYGSHKHTNYHKRMDFFIYTVWYILIAMAWTIFCMKNWEGRVYTLILAQWTNTFTGTIFEIWESRVDASIDVTYTWTGSCIKDWISWIVAWCLSKCAFTRTSICVESWVQRICA